MDSETDWLFSRTGKNFFIYYSRKGLHLLGLYLSGQFRSA